VEREKDVTPKTIALVGALSLALAAHATTLKVSKESFGKTWPLMVDSGTLSCEREPGSSQDMVTFTNATGTYALNGAARARAQQKGWFAVQGIWRPNPEVPGTRMDISVLITPGLKLCAR
jgi:hypothetical protein